MKNQEKNTMHQNRFRHFRKAALLLVFCLLLPAVLAGCSGSQNSGSGTGAGNYGSVIKAEIEIKDHGTIKLDLYPDQAPETVENFCSLAKDGFYDGLTFHRVINGFMMQGGDPQGTGLGGSGKNIVGEFRQNGHSNPIPHVRGTISMARAKDFNSASSQFFICQKDSSHLDGAYAAFGMVTEGIEVVDEVCINTPVTDSNGTVPKGSQPVITKITIVE